MMSTRQEAIDAVFITVTDDDRADPVRMREMQAEATRTGKMLVGSLKPSHDRREIDKFVSSLVSGAISTLDRGDNRKFLDNLGAIASGRIGIA